MPCTKFLHHFDQSVSVLKVVALLLKTTTPPLWPGDHEGMVIFQSCDVGDLVTDGVCEVIQACKPDAFEVLFESLVEPEIAGH